MEAQAKIRWGRWCVSCSNSRLSPNQMTPLTPRRWLSAMSTRPHSPTVSPNIRADSGMYTDFFVGACQFILFDTACSYPREQEALHMLVNWRGTVWGDDYRYS